LFFIEYVIAGGVFLCSAGRRGEDGADCSDEYLCADADGGSYEESGDQLLCDGVSGMLLIGKLITGTIAHQLGAKHTVTMQSVVGAVCVALFAYYSGDVRKINYRNPIPE